MPHPTALPHSRAGPRTHRHTHPGRSLLLLLTLGGVLATCWRCVSGTHQRRHHIPVADVLPERLHEWEGEGGRPDPGGAVARAGDLPPEAA